MQAAVTSFTAHFVACGNVDIFLPEIHSPNTIFCYNNKTVLAVITLHFMDLFLAIIILGSILTVQFMFCGRGAVYPNRCP